MTIKTQPKWGEGERLLTIYRELTAMVKDPRTRPLFAVIEDLPKNAMSAGITGQAAGIVRLVLTQWTIPYVKIPPATLKKFATGKGNADKPAMREAWLRYADEDNKDDNQVDAAWLRLVGHYLKGADVLLPPDQLKVVDAYKE